MSAEYGRTGEGHLFEKATALYLPYLFAVLPVIVCGFFLLYNCFHLSIVKDTKQFALLMAVGMTGRQKSAVLFRQSMFLAAIGIVSGIAGSIFVSRLALPVYLRTIYTDTAAIHLTWHPYAFVLSALIPFLIVRLGAELANSETGQKSIISSVRNISPARTGKITAWIQKKSAADKRLAGFSKTYQMALANAFRNFKANLHVILSLWLAMTAFCGIQIITSGIDPESIAGQKLENHDFVLSNATYFNDREYFDPDPPLLGERMPQHVFSPTFIDDLKKQKGMMINTVSVIPVYLNSAPDPDEGGKFFSLSDEALQGHDTYDSGSLVGASDSFYEKLDPKIKAGTTLADFQAGNITFANSYRLEAFEEDFTLTGYVPGNGGKDFIHYPGDNDFVLTARSFAPPDYQFIWKDQPTGFFIYCHEDVLKQFNRQIPMIVRIEIDVDPPFYFEAESYLQSKFGENYMVRLENKMQLTAWLDAIKNAVHILGFSLTAIIALIGILSFINASLISADMRKKEFAILRSLGMTQSSLRKMLMLEGMYYAGIIVFLAIWPGSAIIRLLYFRITSAVTFPPGSVIPFILASVVVCTFLTLIPVAVLTPESKKSVSQALQEI